ncbi:MAG: hypothetical protein GY816_17310, partial [Cytophagales bacterium]|nr:hypothetical protein [Cytophagales bacterium]
IKVAPVKINAEGRFKVEATNYDCRGSVSLPKNVSIGTVGKAELMSFGQMKLTMERVEREKWRKTEANHRIQKEGLYDGRADKLVEILPIGENATETEKERVREIVREYNDVFAVEEWELGDCNIMEVEIDTREAKPIAQPLRRMPITVRDKVDQEIAVMMEMGII